MNTRSISATALAVSTLLLSGPIARAVFDDFNDGNDTGWSRYDPLAAFGAPSTFSFPSGGYRIQTGTSPNPALLGPARAASFRPDATFGTFHIELDIVAWNDTINQAFGIVSRATQVGLGTTDGYGLLYVNQDTDFVLIRINDEAVTVLDLFNLTLDPANDYRLIFDGSGSSLSGQIFDLTNPGPALGSVAATDASFANGSSGILAAANAATATADATFDNFNAVVPEPTSAALLLTGLALCIRRPRRA